MKFYDFGVSLLIILLFASALYVINDQSDGQVVKDAKGAVHEVTGAVKGAVK